MDRLTALVAIAHLKLRLEVMQRHPEFWGICTCSRSSGRSSWPACARAWRARQLDNDIAFTGQRYHAVLDAIDEQHASLRGHVGSLESEKSSSTTCHGRRKQRCPKRWQGRVERLGDRLGRY